MRKRKINLPADRQQETSHSRLDQASRQRQLVDATMQVIAVHGISGMTLQRVAEVADITAGMVNFHFKSKEALLTATLEALVQEYAGELSSATAATDDPAEALVAIIERHFSPPLMTPHRTALWYAFWGEIHARQSYQQICAEADRFLWRLVHEQMMQLHPAGIDAALARGATSAFIGMIQVFLQELMLAPDESDRYSVVGSCLSFLRHLFPGKIFLPQQDALTRPGNDINITPAITERSADWVVATLREIEAHLARGTTLADICTRQRLDARMIAALRRKFHGMSLEQVRYVLALESRNLKLTESLADRLLRSDVEQPPHLMC